MSDETKTPVAWRSRRIDGFGSGSWSYWAEKPSWTSNPDEKREVQPLYLGDEPEEEEKEEEESGKRPPLDDFLRGVRIREILQPTRDRLDRLEERMNKLEPSEADDADRGPDIPESLRPWLELFPAFSKYGVDIPHYPGCPQSSFAGKDGQVASGGGCVCPAPETRRSAFGLPPWLTGPDIPDDAALGAMVDALNDSSRFHDSWCHALKPPWHEEWGVCNCFRSRNGLSEDYRNWLEERKIRERDNAMRRWSLDIPPPPPPNLSEEAKLRRDLQEIGENFKLKAHMRRVEDRLGELDVFNWRPPAFIAVFLLGVLAGWGLLP